MTDGRSTRIIFSESAREDRRAIIAYTVEQFGIEQARRLRTRFERVVNTLANNPSIGHRRKELDPAGHNFRYFAVMKRFVIVYQSSETTLRVARILHGVRDLAAELNRDAGDQRMQSP